MRQDIIKIGLLGLGTVGSGVVKMLATSGPNLIDKCGCQVEIKKILVQNLQKTRKVDVPRQLLTLNVWEILNDPDIEVVIEVVGGIVEAKDYVMAALKRGKHVITANKDLIATYGAELHKMADYYRCKLMYEAAVAGAIPIVNILKQSFAADRIYRIIGIVNGTTNFILSKMSEEGVSYQEALTEAQQLGYAEVDPSADVLGLDAARKMAILATLAFSCPVQLSDVTIQGISHISQKEIQQAKEKSCVVKLIGNAQISNGQISVSVAPMLLPLVHPLAQVNDCFNAIYVHGESLGEAMFYGRGAGMMPTASAVVGDLFEILRGRGLAPTNKLYQNHMELE